MAYLFKKSSVIVMGIAVLTLCFGIAFGAQKKDATPKKTEAQAQAASEAAQAVAVQQAIEAAPAAEAPKAPVKKTKEELAAEKAAQEAAAKKMEMVNAAKGKLNNTSWNITLTQSTDKPNKEVIKDTVRFTDGKIESEKLIAEGFSPSNFTLRIKREDKAIWETMQTGKEGELAFWRGEIPRDPKDGTLGNVMNGVLSRHLNDKARTVKDYTFMSEAKGAATPEVPKEEPVVEMPPTAEETPASIKPAEKQPAETKKEAPKKKGWGR